ncbi:MAG: GAF domain-containing protein, partial [Planktothrix sp.]
MKFYRRFLPYVIALGWTALAVRITLWLEPFILRTIGAFFYLAIIITTWYGGGRPGMVVIVLSTAAINYWFIPPQYQFGISRLEDVIQLSLFFVVSCSINLLTSNFRDSKQKIEQLSQKLAQENIDQRQETQELLQQKFEQQRLVSEISQRIRQSLNLQDILQTTVDEVRDYLKTDRVIIFKFTPTWGGTIIVESVAQEWMPILPLQIYDPCIGEEYVQPFIEGLVTAKSDIYNSGISPCHIEFLAQLQVRANLVVPIMKGDQLWGLLAAHHCQAPRQWQDSEIKFLQQLAIQVSVALGQAALLEAAQTELAERKQAQVTLQQRETILRLFVQYAPADIAMFDRDMCYVMASQHWVDQYNLESVESLINRSHYEIFPEIPERWRQIHQRCLAGAVEKCDEDLLVRLDGTRQWMWWEVHPWYTTENEIGGIIIFAVDVTKRKQVEIALQELN